MNRKLIHFVAACFALLFFTSLCTHAAPDHLEPCPVGCSYYDAALFSALLNNTYSRLGMIVLAPSGRHDAVIIHQRVETEEVDARVIIKSRQWFLKYVEFKEPFKRPITKHYYDINTHFDIDWTNDLHHFEIPIDSSFEMVVRDAWVSVLASTKYSANGEGGMDDIPYIFYCDRYYGYTCSPYTGSLALLVELGDKLSLLAQSEEQDRGPLKKQCLELAKAIKKATNPDQGVDPTPANAKSIVPND
jgi:hypothetical protein